MKRIATVEDFKALPEGRAILLSEKRNKKLKHHYLLDWCKGPHFAFLTVDGIFTTEHEAAEYLPAKIIWQGKY